MPAVSVIIPTYNRADILPRAINSILSQTYDDLEIIIIDDGSSEDIQSVLESIKSGKLKLIKHTENRGIAAARNTGIRASDSKYIALLDNDDEWLPEKLEMQIKLMETEPAETAISDTGFINIIKNKSYYIPGFEQRNKNSNIYRSIISKHFILPSTILLRRECFLSTGIFDENIPVFDDWDYFFRILNKYRIKSINEPLIRRYHHTDNVSSKVDIVLNGYTRLVEKHYTEISEDRPLLSICYLKLGQMSCFQGEAEKGREYLLKSIRINRLELRSYIAYLLSLLGKRFYRGSTMLYRAVAKTFEGP